MMKAAQASRRLGLTGSVSFTGALAWPFLYPWPQRPPGLIETRSTNSRVAGVRSSTPMRKPASTSATRSIRARMLRRHYLRDVLERTGNHPRCAINYDPSHFVLQQLDYLAFIDIYHERIRAFHVKDAEFHPNGRSGVYGGYQDWIDRPGRFRSLGDGQIDFKRVFSKFAQYDYPGWAVLEWECCLKHPEDGAREGAAFIRDHIIRVTDRAFDDFAKTQ
jgi:Sugar phosphate isomerases/epimerases